MPTLYLPVSFAVFNPVDTLFKPWIFMYILPTLDHKEAFANLGHVCTLSKPWTLRYLFSTFNLLLPFFNIGPLGIFLLQTMELHVTFAFLGPLGPIAYLGLLGTYFLPVRNKRSGPKAKQVLAKVIIYF